MDLLGDYLIVLHELSRNKTFVMMNSNNFKIKLGVSDLTVIRQENYEARI